MQNYSSSHELGLNMSRSVKPSGRNLQPCGARHPTRLDPTPAPSLSRPECQAETSYIAWSVQATIPHFSVHDLIPPAAPWLSRRFLAPRVRGRGVTRSVLHMYFYSGGLSGPPILAYNMDDSGKSRDRLAHWLGGGTEWWPLGY